LKLATDRFWQKKAPRRQKIVAFQSFSINHRKYSHF
jgi:hypothetical protein